MDDGELVAHWLHCAHNPVICDLIDDLHAQLRQQVERVRPVCSLSGRCCRFESYGHRLFVTGVEAAVALVCAGASLRADTLAQAHDRGRCPFQDDRLCTIHPHRPLACRVFYCDPAWEASMEEVAGRLHDRLRRIHEMWSIVYRYDEWRAILSLFVRAGAFSGRSGGPGVCRPDGRSSAGADTGARAPR